MKACKFCSTQVENHVLHCPSCGSAVFLHICENCGTAFDSGFCPNCGVKAGQKKKICPDCGSAYFTNACPNCGYTPSRKPAVQKIEQTVIHKHVYEHAPVRTAPTPTQARQVKKNSKGCGCGSIILVIIILGLLFSGNKSSSKKNTTSFRATNTPKVTAKVTKSGPTNTPLPTATPEPDVAAAQAAVNKYYAALEDAGETPDPDMMSEHRKAINYINSTRSRIDGKTASATSYTPDVSKAAWKEGRGITSSKSEPDYIGVLGYAAVHKNENIDDRGAFLETPWQVPVYQPDKQFWAEAGTISHKTQVVVIGQKLEKKTSKQYQGYLQIIRMDTEETCWLKVENFVTEPYWEMNLSRATEDGYCLATFNQISNYYPVTHGNRKAELKDGTTVLLPLKSTVISSSPDRTNNSICGIFCMQKNNRYQTETVWFNEADLTLSY